MSRANTCQTKSSPIMKCIIKKDGSLKVPRNKYADGNEVYSFKGRTIDIAMPIRVFRNLTKKGVWYSIQQDRLTVAHATRLCIADCRFVVSQKGRERVVRTGRKEFHAYIEGLYTTSGMGTSAERNDLPAHIKYDPFKYKEFTCTNLTIDDFTVKGARFSICDENGVNAAYTNR